VTDSADGPGQRIASAYVSPASPSSSTQARSLGPVAAPHSAGLVLVGIVPAGALGALALPAVRNTAMDPRTR